MSESEKPLDLLDAEERIVMFQRIVKKIQTEREQAELVRVAYGHAPDTEYRDGASYARFIKECDDGLKRLRADYPDRWEALVQRTQAPDLVDELDGEQAGSEDS